MYHFDLIIHGGGLAGASLAIALAPSRLRIALVESDIPQGIESPDTFDNRIYAVSPTNVAWLESIGVWKHLDPARIAQILRMRVFGNTGGQIEFSAYEVGIAELGSVIESSTLLCELWQNLKRQANLTLFSPARAAHVDFSQPISISQKNPPTNRATNTAVLTLEDGRILSAPLIVGADGRDSWLRRTAGLEAFDTPYHELGIVANFKCTKGHQQTAWQWFQDDGVLAYLPLPGERISIVWSASKAKANELLKLDRGKFAQQVALAGGHVLGDLQQITPAAAFPLRLIRVPQIVAPRLALIGDAAHGIHPLSGHGINLGFQDAQVLANLLSSCREWSDPGDVLFLRRYQRARREEVVLLQTSTDWLRRLFKNRIPGGTTLLNTGLSLTNRLPLVKSLLVRYATGTIDTIL